MLVEVFENNGGRPSSGSRSSKVIDFGANRKPIGPMQLLLVINSDFARISYCFPDIDAQSWKTACFTHPTLV